mgnify:CR=1 FL=1
MAYRKNGEFYEIKGFYMEVFLIRHTKTAVIPGTCYGNSDVDVADSFPEEAEKVRGRLKGERLMQCILAHYNVAGSWPFTAVMKIRFWMTD